MPIYYQTSNPSVSGSGQVFAELITASGGLLGSGAGEVDLVLTLDHQSPLSLSQALMQTLAQQIANYLIANGGSASVLELS